MPKLYDTDVKTNRRAGARACQEGFCFVVIQNGRRGWLRRHYLDESNQVVVNISNKGFIIDLVVEDEYSAR